MKIFLALCLALLVATSATATESNLKSDEKGNITGTIDGKRVNMRTDKYGNTTGTIGGAKINTHTDLSGNTTGTIGKKTINIPAEQLAETPTRRFGQPKPNPSALAPGAVNNSILNSYVENPGNTTGKGGHRNINKKGLGQGDEDF